MYEAFFQLQRRPFAAAPRVDQYFPARSIEAARQNLARCIERAEGAGMLIGPSGSGKTLLVQTLAEQFRDQYAIALLATGHLTTRRAMLQAILFELGLPYRGLEEGELRLSLIDHLLPSSQCPRGMLLLLDEAHALPLRLLEEVRMITNFMRDGQPRVRLVMSGGPALEERFASPKLESFSQRVSTRCYLESLDRGETAAYVRAQLASLGGNPDQIFAPEALDQVYRATDGIPRLVNQLCDHALVMGFAGGRATVTADGIEEAWADLQQLPTPWNESRPKTRVATGNDNVVEFGHLEDESSPPIAAGDDDAQSHFESTLQASERLDELTAHVESLEEEFEPAGKIGPEAELVFTPSSDPFGVEFDDEEVVFDRYAAADVSLGASRPVYSADGAMLAGLLKPFLQSPPPAELPLAASLPATEPLVVEAADQQPLLDDSEWQSPVDRTLVPDDFNPSDDPVLPEVAVHVAETDHAPVMSVHAAEERLAVAHEPVASIVAEAEPDDADVMIIEDDPVIHGPSSVPSPVVRRQEFRQLFARLRRS